MALLAVVGVGAGCGNSADGPPVATIYVSAPTTGPAAAEGNDIVDGAKLAAKDAGGEVGGAKIEVKVLDDATADTRFDPVQTAENSRQATEDSTAIAYIGELDSGATRVSLPITNSAGILQVSPGSGASDLVRDQSFNDDVPTRFQTTGKRTFARLVPDDEKQGAAAAGLLAKAPGTGAVIVDDGSSFGQELTDGFLGAMPDAVVAPQGVDKSADDVTSGCAKATRALSLFGAGRSVRGRPVANPRIFLAAEPGCSLKLLAEARKTGVDFTVVASDAMRSPQGLASLREFSSAQLTSATKTAKELPPVGRKMLARFLGRFHRRPGPYAPYGYEAMASVLAAIDRSDDATDRDSVVSAYFDGTSRDSVLGRYAIDDLGETSLGVGSPFVVAAAPARR